jgi:hypothetical protein
VSKHNPVVQGDERSVITKLPEEAVAHFGVSFGSALAAAFMAPCPTALAQASGHNSPQCDRRCSTLHRQAAAPKLERLDIYPQDERIQADSWIDSVLRIEIENRSRPFIDKLTSELG